VVAAALSLLLVAFGIGVGFSVVSPWADSGVSSTTFTIAAGVYLIVVAMIPSTIGGYLAGRLRSKWHMVHEHERYFRDSAHGFIVWALATVVIAAFLSGAVAHLIAGAGGKRCRAKLAGRRLRGRFAAQQSGSAPAAGCCRVWRPTGNLPHC
jgi:hypothetical protein